MGADRQPDEDAIGAWGTDGMRYWRGTRPPESPEEAYDNELFTLPQAAAMLGLSESYLRVAASRRYRSGRFRLRSYRVGMGNKRMVTRRDLHVFAMSRAGEGQGSGLYKGVPRDWVHPPYTDERLARVQEEIAALIVERDTEYKERHGGTPSDPPPRMCMEQDLTPVTRKRNGTH